ncbi:hypothetical protein [Ralstonia solanacearum]|nr:hypothetical protein [Ralstonia solanacearum]
MLAFRDRISQAETNGEPWAKHRIQRGLELTRERGSGFGWRGLAL